MQNWLAASKAGLLIYKSNPIHSSNRQTVPLRSLRSGKNSYLWIYYLYSPVCNVFAAGKSITRAIGRVHKKHISLDIIILHDLMLYIFYVQVGSLPYAQDSPG